MTQVNEEHFVHRYLEEGHNSRKKEYIVLIIYHIITINELNTKSLHNN